MPNIILLLMLVGTISAQESGNDSEDEVEDYLPSAEDVPDMSDEEIDQLTSCQMKECHNVSLSFDERMNPDQAKCHYYYYNCRKPFFKAQRFCRSHRGQLSSIHNKHTNRVLVRFVQKQSGNRGFVWIGVYKRICGGYRNVDGSSLNYTNWAMGKRRTRGRWCTALNVNNGLWYSVRCHARLPFFCTI